MAKQRERTYTSAQVRALREQLGRKHRNELDWVRMDYYERGKRHGRDELRDELCRLLNVKQIKEEGMD